MKKIFVKFLIILICIITTRIASGQWVSVLDNVIPVKIAISPDYLLDQTIYILDDQQRIFISETGGLNWTTLYEAGNPSDPAQAVLDIVLSPNFKNDDAIIMIHKDGTAKLSYDRGQNWITFPAPAETASIVYSPKVMEDYKLFSVTGAYGPVKFYKSVNGGAVWSFVSDLGIGVGFYCRLWNSSDTASVANMAVLYDNNTVYVTSDAGQVWTNSFSAQVSVRDLVYSPAFSVDHTLFIADAAEIFKNVNGGDQLSWVSVGTFSGSYGIKFAISQGFQQDQTIFAAVDQVGIVRSTDGGSSWNAFNDGFGSSLPISIAISPDEPYTLFAGSIQTGGAPDKLWRYQTSSGISGQGNPAKLKFSSFPNPFSSATEITYETHSKGNVQLSLYDITGKKLKVLINENLDKGIHRVNLDCTDVNISPGIYFCILEVLDNMQALKLVIGHK